MDQNEERFQAATAQKEKAISAQSAEKVRLECEKATQAAIELEFARNEWHLKEMYVARLQSMLKLGWAIKGQPKEYVTVLEKSWVEDSALRSFARAMLALGIATICVGIGALPLFIGAFCYILSGQKRHVKTYTLTLGNCR